MREIGVDAGALRMLGQRRQQVFAQFHEHTGAALTLVQAPEQLLPRRFDRRLSQALAEIVAWIRGKLSQVVTCQLPENF